jgi:hypothetical protein
LSMLQDLVFECCMIFCHVQAVYNIINQVNDGHLRCNTEVW